LKNTAVLALALFAAAHAQQDCGECVNKFVGDGGCDALHAMDGDKLEAISGNLPSFCHDNCDPALALDACGVDPSMFYDGPSGGDGGVDCYSCASAFDMAGGCAAMHNGDEAAIHAAIPSEECGMMCGEFAAEYCGMGAPSDGGNMYDGPSDGPAGCPSPYWVGDNLCDAENNTPECGFDGGDCCIDDVVTTYCGDNCVCNDPDSPNFGNWAAPSEEPSWEEPSYSANDACAAPWWFGDNYCDDENNTPECGFDGGDCCGPDVNTTYCSDCLCLE
jgi:hypothetical protein